MHPTAREDTKDHTADTTDTAGACGAPGADTLTGRLEQLPLSAPVDALARADALDSVTGPLRDAVHALPLGTVRDLLRGRWLGHPLHPLLVQVPMGAWLSAGVLDLLPGTERAGRVLVGTGVLAALPAALAGWTDWADTRPEQQRTGVVHAAANSLAVGLYAASFVARLRGRRWRGRALGYAGMTAASVGGMIGGHLAYRQAVGVNKAEPVPHVVPEGWHRLGSVSDFPVGEPSRFLLGEVPLLVVREPDEAGGRVRVLADRCSHQSGALSGGRIADGCVTCPLHGSVFRLADGANVGGPATAPQPVFETRTADDGGLEVRLP